MYCSLKKALCTLLFNFLHGKYMRTIKWKLYKMELYLTNNDFADILAFVEQTDMVSLTSL